jgi:hypothetical protein
MNVIEAIKSGKRFRRASWNPGDWAEPHEAEEVLKNTMFEALMAEDWEVEQQVISVTKTQVCAAWSKAMAKWAAKPEYTPPHMTPLPEFLEELGFKE